MTSTNHVLLTGATGMVGCHLLVKLVQRGHRVAVLVRPTDKLAAADRVAEVLRRFDIDWDETDDRIRVLPGTLTEDSLGLSAADRQWGKQHVSSVLHCAASLSFRPASESPDNEPYRTNVQGTETLLSVCADWSLRSFHYVSTAYVCGDRRGVVLETDADSGQGFANDYEQSKSQSEAMVRSVTNGSVARVPVSIYRPSIVIDSTGRSPVTRDRTIYGAYQTYQALARKFGLPKSGGWFRSLGFGGGERKNLIEADWVADAIVTLFDDEEGWGQTYHLTAPNGTSIADLEDAFREACLRSGKITESQSVDQAAEASAVFQTMAAPYVQTFLPYFNDDPVFDGTQINAALSRQNVSLANDVDSTAIASLLEPQAAVTSSREHGDDIVVVGYEVALPGGADSAEKFERVLFENQSVIDEVPTERFDRELYYDPKRGEVGKAYTTMGGCVGASAIDVDVARQAECWGEFDECHLKFASVVASAWKRAGIPDESTLANDCGIYVGHSGGTKDGGPLAMATMAESAIAESTHVDSIGVDVSARTIKAVTEGVRRHRPHRRTDRGTHFNAYSAASLAARVMGLRGIREVIDAACASSLVALRHACIAIKNRRIEAAVVGGATYNNVDNLILFSQSQACSTSESCPFDEDASGLISSEGYVAVVVMRRAAAQANGLTVIATIESVGVATDGRGKSLWAPRTEGQQLAIRRAYSRDTSPLDIDYMECHATSTQVGDATELNSLTVLRGESMSSETVSDRPLLIGSAKSNLGHTLEAAGLVGLVKVLTAMKRGLVPASIHFRKPTSHFDWSSGQVQIAARNEAWPNSKSGRPKRAAVNAFGIGGLNAHAIVREEAATSTRRLATHRVSAAREIRNEHPQTDDPIAIVGRGVVLPGAFNIDDFAMLLRSGQSNLSPPPEGRWPGLESVDPSAVCAFKTPHCVGGYIQNYSFNGQPYRIPPKQVKLANPVQMMLIDAVRQALDEIGEPSDFAVAPGDGVIDRKRTSVVIGTIFGGEFSNQLQVGMRLPELCKRFAAELLSEGYGQEDVDAWTSRYRHHMLDRCSALMDETGSFTASTLASRVAKTFDLMGGACAIDADDASGMLAIMTAVDQLRSGDVDTVVCGVAQRSLDLVAYEQLNLRGQLVTSGLAQDIPDHCGQIIPGEGVAVLILKRADDAVSAAMDPQALIGRLETGFSDSAERTKRDFLGSDRVNASLIRQVGYLSGAHSLVRMIAQTCEWSCGADAKPVISLAAVAEDGFTISASISKQHDPTPLNAQPAVIRSMTHQQDSANKRSAKSLALRVSATSSLTPLSTVVHRAASRSDLIDRLMDWKASPENSVSNRSSIDIGEGDFVAAFVADDQSRLASQLDALMAELNSGATCKVVDAADGLLWTVRATNNRVGWLFPGQGSQYSRVPALFGVDASAKQSLRDVDSALESLGLDLIGDRLSDPEGALGKDIWWTQLWILAVSHAMAESLRHGGVRCDVASGHSFGECGAALHSGAMSLSQAIRFARQRSDAVLTSVRECGQLLSIRGSASRVAAVLRDAGSTVVITHHNAPQQTVVAGTKDQIGSAKKVLSDAGLAAVVIAVPAAFHTPMMEGAESILRNTFSTQQLRPPACGLLSAISLRYLAEPNEIRDNLTGQLTRPVLFSAAVERMIADGCGLIVEVGPSDVLTRLTRATAGQQALSLSLDAGSDHAKQLALIQLASQVVCGTALSTVIGPSQPVFHQANPSNNGQANVSTPQTTGGQPEPAVLDVTSNRANGRVGPGRTTARIESPADSDPQAKTVAAVEPAASTTSVSRPAHVESFLVDLVVELTGYSPDVIDFDADLEAELGIDSIKKAQVIGELAEWAAIELDLTTMKLSDYESLADIAALHPSDGREQVTADGSVSGMATAAKVPSKVAEPVALSIGNGLVAKAEATQSSATVNASSSIAESMESLMIDFVVDQTGYSVDVIDMDADLEAELGLDSIKKAQLLGELQETFDLSVIQLGQIKLADFPTLRSIQTFVLGQLGIDDVVETDEVSEKKNSPSSEPSVAATLRKPSPQHVAVPSRGTCRFVLKTVPADRLSGVPAAPKFSGAAIVLGHNSTADEIERRLMGDSVLVYRPSRMSTVEQVDAWLEDVWDADETPHLFIATPRDADALGDLNSRDWNARRELALTVPFRVCQQWMQRMIDVDRMGDATLVSVLNAGGQFGFDVDQLGDHRASQVDAMPTPESGGIAGLTKAMLIEAWMRGYRETPMLVVDGARGATDESIVDGIWREMVVPSYDEEVVVDGASRWAIDADYAPLDASSSMNSNVSKGGAWIVSGGGRGITALTAGALAEQHGLSLHLLGTAPEPNLDEATRAAAVADHSELRRQVMRAAQAENRNPIETWRDLEKAIEIDQTLRDFGSRGIRAKYYCVDVSNADDVRAVCESVRKQDGPIRGVIHGAGAGQDARFDRKRPEKVAKCIGAKVDGCIHLADATRDDPLEWFVGFGSISGRFGANGHTDYSLSNDMLAKCIDRLKQSRPNVRCVTFHWHAWGDIGMAAKPEAKLALEMIGMEFMPAEEGLTHFINELNYGGDRSEVLITDRRYVRKFFPTREAERGIDTSMPMLDPSESGIAAADSYRVTLDPIRDRFLAQHLVGGRPTLPMVMAIEMMAEAAKQSSDGREVVAFRNVYARQALKFTGEDAMAVEIVRDRMGSQIESDSWCVQADLRRKDGRLVEEGRRYFEATFEFGSQRRLRSSATESIVNVAEFDWTSIEYLPPDAAIHHGESLQCLRSIHVDPGQRIIGRIATPSPAHLGGEHRPLSGWQICCSSMDACLYAAAVFAYQSAGQASLPVKFDRIDLGRIPQPGEPLQVHWTPTSRDDSGMVLAGSLLGVNGDVLMRFDGYRIGWLR